MSASSWLVSDTTMVLSFQLPRGRVTSYSTLFENNSYLRLLNKLLQLELSLVEMYKRCEGSFSESEMLLAQESHRLQARNLVNLIVYNRGIPEEKGFSITPEISRLAHGLGRHLGRSLAHRTSRMTCLHLERMLQRRYNAAIAEAPYSDRSILQDHLKRGSKNIAWLQSEESKIIEPI